MVIMRLYAMKFRGIIFDLDGTLINTIEDISNAMNHALADEGFPGHSYETYMVYVGDGLRVLAARSIPGELKSDELIDRITGKMTAYYREHCLDRTSLYNGMPEILDFLEMNNVPKCILSNKKDDLTRLITGKLLSKWSFVKILGMTDEIPPKPAPDGALYLAGRMNLAPLDVLYLGDTGTDMDTAVQSGMYPVGAAWGFRGIDELKSHGAGFIAHRPMDIREFF